mgnify:CR=1 FL=1
MKKFVSEYRFNDKQTSEFLMSNTHNLLQLFYYRNCDDCCSCCSDKEVYKNFSILKTMYVNRQEA